MDRRQFCDTVTRQLRCRWEAPAVRQELSDHIQDHMDALLSGGMGREEAEEAAVAAMNHMFEKKGKGKFNESNAKAFDAGYNAVEYLNDVSCAR